jgi:hypothetical protein
MWILKLKVINLINQLIIHHSPSSLHIHGTDTGDTHNTDPLGGGGSGHTVLGVVLSHAFLALSLGVWASTLSFFVASTLSFDGGGRGRGYESFLQQVNLAEQLTSSDFGVSTGLISQGYWESSKWYFVNVERGNIADKLQPRNINLSFTNNSNVPIDVIIFTFYSDQFTIDVETGIVTKYFFFYNIVISFATT